MKDGTERDDAAGAVSANAQQLIHDLRDANGMLVHAALRAKELQDEAESARHAAEEASKKAEIAREAAQVLAEALAVKDRELRATAEFREQLMGIVGHDLRNPLHAILMSSTLLGRHGALREADKKLVERIENSARRMTRMISELLDFTRARLGGGLALDLKPTNFREVCKHVVEELEVGSHAKVECDFRGDLTGTWDADRLAELLSNIAGNAVDHAAPSSAVSITASEGGPDVFIEIRNQGDPIPSDVLPVLFQPFRRAQQDGPSNGGHLGLGLYIASEVVRAHGGDLSARSSDGATTFAIRLPRQPQSPESRGWLEQRSSHGG